MGIIRENFLHCDCHLSADCFDNFGVDTRPNTNIKLLRQASQENGWRFIYFKPHKKYYDWCPECVKKFIDKRGSDNWSMKNGRKLGENIQEENMVLGIGGMKKIAWVKND